MANNIDISDLRELDLDNEENLLMNLEGAEIYFDDTLDKIYISDELKVYRSRREIEIAVPERGFFSWLSRRKDKEHKIVVGTARDYQSIDINAGGLSISGNVKGNSIYINAGGLAISGEIYSRNLTINGAGIDLDGYIESESMVVNGAGIALDLDLVSIEDITVNGAGVDAKLKYLDSWAQLRYITINGVGGDLEVELPQDIEVAVDSRLSIKTGGFVSSSVEYY